MNFMQSNYWVAVFFIMGATCPFAVSVLAVIVYCLLFAVVIVCDNSSRKHDENIRQIIREEMRR
jgi:hypothetical protein